MCLLALALGQSEAWPLLLASNRDEFFHRPTQPLAHWRSDSGMLIVSGRDALAGGTWLGLTPGARVALLTNVREPGATVGARSRGELPLAWLHSSETAEHFLAQLDGQAYSGFNLVVGDMRTSSWHWASNRQPSPSGVTAGWQQRALAPGVYGLSNAFLDTPWPKTQRLKRAMQAALSTQDQAEQLLWQALADASPATDADMPQTGVAPDIEKQLSSAWVRFADGRYGTRASTLVKAGTTAQGWAVQVQEKTWSPEGSCSLREERLHWPSD